MDGSVFDCTIGTLDVIEKDALDRKSCMEVLRRLISGADAEIEKLEGELLVLETQIEWAEHNKHTDLFDLCSKALGERTNSLKLSICSLKNHNNHNDENDNALQSEMDSKPVMKIHEIIKLLLSNNFHDKEEQDGLRADNITKEEGSDAQDHSINQSGKEQNLNLPADGRQAGVIVTPDGSDALGYSLRQSDYKENLDLIVSSPTNIEEVKEANVAPKDDDHTYDSSFKNLKMTEDRPEKVKFQVVDAAHTTKTVSPKSALMLPVTNEKYTTESEQVEIQVPNVSVPCKVVGLKPPLKLQTQKVRDNVLSEKLKVQKSAVANTPKSDSLKSSLMLQKQKELLLQRKRARDKNLPENIKFPNVAEAKTTNSDSLNPSPILEGQKEKKLQKQRQKDKIQSEKNKVRKAGSTSAAVSEGLKSYSRQKKQHVPDVIDVQEPGSSATGKAVTLKSPLKSQGKLKKDVKRFDKYKGEENGVADTTSDDKLQSNFKLRRQNTERMTQSEQVDVQKSRISLTNNIDCSETFFNSFRQRVECITQSNTIKVQKADNGLGNTLYSSAGLEKITKLERDVSQSDPMVIQFGVAPYSENVVQSKKGRKQHNQVGAPISSSIASNSSKLSTSKKRRTKAVVLSSSDEAEEPSKRPMYEHFSVESVFTSCSDEMSKAVERRDEPQQLRCNLEPSNLSNIDDFHKETSGVLVGPNELCDMSLPRLKSLAKSRGIRGISKFNKEKLIQTLRGDQSRM